MTLKIEQVLIHYLLKYKELTLQNIGTFRLESVLPDIADPERPIIIPEGAISYQYNPKAGVDPNLIQYITEHTGKITPLAASDLESYITLGKQFLNIGNPFILHNIGTLHKNNAGDLFFKGGNYVADKMDPQRKIEDEGAEEHDENMFNEYQRKPDNSRAKLLLAVVTIVVLGLISWAVYEFAFNKEAIPDNANSTEVITPLSDSLYNDSISKTVNLRDSIQRRPAGLNSFKAVVNEYDNIVKANSRLAQLNKYGRNVIVFTTDSIIYKVAEPFAAPLSDTTRVIDSLSKYYGKNKVKIEY